MLFNSSAYILLFLPCAAAGYFLLNQRRLVRAAGVWLLLASLLFYGQSRPSHLMLLASSILANFVFGRLLQRAKRDGGRQNVVLAAGILFNAVLLVCCKQADFLLENVGLLLGISLPLPHLALPLAISFFTFQQIAYLVDCCREDAKECSFLDYGLFVAFFPQLLAGPISRCHELMPQFGRLKNKLPSHPNASLGLLLFSLGLFKKAWAADQFAVWADLGFASKEALTFFDAWGASLSYSFQLYFDFSGYTDMALGSALFFNIRLPVNFDSPYRSRSIQEFWRRWHMTLSRWLRDYLYIPLGGSRKGQLRTCINLLATFFIAGLWHGAGWTFAVWGLLHGAALVLHRLWKGLGLRMPAVLGWLATFLFVNASWAIFRAANLQEGLQVLKGMAGLNGIVVGKTAAALVQHRLAVGSMLLPTQTYWHLLAFGLVILLLPNSCRISGLLPSEAESDGLPETGRAWSLLRRALLRRAGRALLCFQPNCYWAVLSGVLFSMALYRLLQVAPTKFLYFNF